MVTVPERIYLLYMFQYNFTSNILKRLKCNIKSKCIKAAKYQPKRTVHTA